MRAVVCRGGRPDLAGDALEQVHTPALLLVGAEDDDVIVLNQAAAERMPGRVEVSLIPHATELFEEPGTLDAVARRAGNFFLRHLPAGALRPQWTPVH